MKRAREKQEGEGTVHQRARQVHGSEHLPRGLAERVAGHQRIDREQQDGDDQRDDQDAG